MKRLNLNNADWRLILRALEARCTELEVSIAERAGRGVSTHREHQALTRYNEVLGKLGQ